MELEPVLYSLAGCVGLSIIIATIGGVIMMIRHQGRSHHAQRGSVNVTLERDMQAGKALDVYKELAKDKLEVIKTALTMGYQDEELARLDARLEAMIGKEKLEALLKGASPEALASADLLDTELAHEAERLRQIQNGK